MEGEGFEGRVSEVSEVYGSALPSVESSVYKSSKSSSKKKKKGKKKES
jgi:hypothetical protein